MKSESWYVLGIAIYIIYMWLYIIFTLVSLLPLVWRWQAILKGYNEHVGFFKLLRMQLAGYAVSFFTPSSRIGGEPLKIYMLKKECDINYRTGTASIVLDKYMEYLGSLTFGLLGVILGPLILATLITFIRLYEEDKTVFIK